MLSKMSIDDFFKIVEVGDYVNGYIVSDVNVQGNIIYCNNNQIELLPYQIKDFVSRQDFERVKSNISFIELED